MKNYWIVFALTLLLSACGGGGGGGGAPASYTVGGTVSGLSGTVVLTNNGGDDLSLTANGAFIFATQVANGGAYDIQVKTQPAGQTCSAGNNTGTVPGANVTGVTVTCSTNTYSVGGAVSGPRRRRDTMIAPWTSRAKRRSHLARWVWPGARCCFSAS